MSFSKPLPHRFESTQGKLRCMIRFKTRSWFLQYNVVCDLPKYVAWYMKAYFASIKKKLIVIHDQWSVWNANLTSIVCRSQENTFDMFWVQTLKVYITDITRKCHRRLIIIFFCSTFECGLGQFSRPNRIHLANLFVISDKYLCSQGSTPLPVFTKAHYLGLETLNCPGRAQPRYLICLC